MSGRGGARFNFPQWNYGYTLGPPTQANGGDYTQFFVQQGAQPQLGGLMGPRGVGISPRPPMRGRGGGQGRGGATVKTETPKPTSAQATTDTKEVAAVKKEVDQSAKTASDGTTTPNTEVSKEDGEIVERPINEILRGRNPIMFCNDQSKLRNLHMEWEQVSETGPPHDKTFTWSLKMGEMLTMGSANSKKGAKNKAAEEMVKKLDQLPKINMKRQFNQAFGPPFMGRGGGGGFRGRGRGGGYGHHGPPGPPFFGNNQFQPKKPKKTPEMEAKEAAEKAEKAAAEKAEPLHPAQNNPISKLYEHTKKRKQPEPVFEVVQEEVLETRKTTQGFTYKKTKFTIQCEIMGKKFLGESMNKKTAKFNAAARAWEEIGGGGGAGVGNQASIDSLLAAGRAQSGTGAPATVS